MHIELILSVICLIFAISSVASKGFGKAIVNQFLMSVVLAGIFAYLGNTILAIVLILLSIFGILSYFAFGLKMINMSHTSNGSNNTLSKVIATCSVATFIGAICIYLFSNRVMFESGTTPISTSMISIVASEYWPLILVMTVLANLTLITTLLITDASTEEV